MPLQIEFLGHGPVVRPEPGEGCDYGVIGSIAELREYLRPALQDRILFGSDWEATSLNTRISKPVGLGVSVEKKSARYVPVGHYLEPSANLPIREVLQALKDADAAGAMSCWYNVLFDHPLMRNALGWVPSNWADAMYGVFLVDSNELQIGLKPSSMRFLGLQMQEISQLDEEWVTLSKKQQKLQPFKLIHQLPLDMVFRYGCADPDHTRQIWFHSQVQAAMREQPMIYQLEHAVSPSIQEGNDHGMYLDRDRLVALEAEANAAIDALAPRIYAVLGEEFALTRKQYLAEKVSGLVPEIVERTEGGKPTISVKVLEKYRQAHAVVPLLITYAKLVAQRDNYIVKLRKAQDYFSQQEWAEGRVRFSFHHIGVPTGRMKCGGAGKGKEAYLKGVADVNAQSIPEYEKAPDLPNVRSAFCAPDGFVVVALDYSQIELRVPANLANEPRWIKAFQTGDDIHRANAQAVADVREPGVVVGPNDKKRRGAAKTVSFALMFGGDEHTVSRNSGLPLDESKKIVQAFYRSLRHLKAWMDRMTFTARTQGKVATFLGRIRRLKHYFPPEPPVKWSDEWKAWRRKTAEGEREAINHPVQGGAADIFKIALINIRKAIATQGWGPEVCSPVVHFVHDEVVLYVREDMVEAVTPHLVAAMEFTVKGWAVPLKAEVEVGSRRLYIQEKLDAAIGPERDHWTARLRALPSVDTGTNSTWGELVSYEKWRADYHERTSHSGGCGGRLPGPAGDPMGYSAGARAS